MAPFSFCTGNNMKVWEALDLLRSIDSNAEVTITFGQGTKTVPSPVPVTPPNFYSPYTVPPTYVPWWQNPICEVKH